MKKTFWLTMLCLLIASCQGTEPKNEIALRDCPAGSVQTNTVRLTAPHAAVTAAPPHICVAPGTDITVRITGSPGKGRVATQPKEDVDIWLNGSNASDADEFAVHVPGGIALETYEYNVFWSGKPTLDPRVSVRTEDRD
jgi:hypothetical protein